ncbi:MAG: hypothetical protein B6242_09980 [Anaerolineaceae bacterium 4572_78]|nr:MAG: hypothetical protein B6242_09980 [Anaerolineaceae bacterium 4572_78]
MISTIVCTYNRADLLRDVLQTLCEQTLPKSEYEIIIIDNNSHDHTQTVAHEFCQRYPNIRYAVEMKIGLSHCRNHGWKIAKGEYIAYTDDDCKNPSHWLTLAKKIIDEVHPASFGGPFYPFYNSPRPKWFKTNYGSGVVSTTPRPLVGEEQISGMNNFYRRSILLDLGGFNPNLGMTGNAIAYGEETDLIRRIRAEKPAEVIYYHPDLYVYHLVRHEKMMLWWNMRMWFSGAWTTYLALRGESIPQLSYFQILKQSIYWLFIFGFDVLKGAVWRDRQQYPYWQNYLYEHSFRYLKWLGRLYGQFKRKFSRV